MAKARLVLGSQRSDRTGRLNDLFLRRRYSALLVLPSQKLVRARTRDILDGANLPGILGERILTFTQFVQRLLEREGYDAEPLDDLEREAYLEFALKPLREDGVLAPLGAAAGTEGFRHQLLGVIESLKQAAVEPKAFAECVRQRPAPSPLDAIVGAAYAAYQQALHDANRYDRIGLFWAADLVCREKRPALLDNVDTIVFDAFDDFTGSELRLLKSLAPRLELLAVGLNHDPDPGKSDLFALSRRAVRLIHEELAPEDEVAAPDLPASFTQYAAQYLLTRNRPSHAGRLVQNIRIVKCADTVSEIETIGRRVKTLLLDGVPPEDIALVFRTVEDVAHHVRVVFEEFGIPVFVEAPEPLSTTSPGIFLLQVFEATTAWARDDIAALLANPRLDTAGLLAASPTVARAARVVAGLDEWRQGLNDLRRQLDGEGADKSPVAGLPRARETLGAAVDALTRLAALADAIPATAPLADFFRAAEQIVTQSENREGAECEGNATRRLLSALKRARRLHTADTAPVARAEFVARLRRILHLERVNVDNPPRAIRCLPMDQIRNLRLPYVFFGGANDGVFPQAPGVSAIYSRADLAALVRAGIALRQREEHGNYELSLFQHVLASVETELTVTWRAQSREGREMRPSPFVDDLQSLFEGVRLEAPPPATDAFVPLPEECASPRDLRNAAILRANDLAHAFPDVLREALEGAAVEERRWSETAFDCYDGCLAAADSVNAVAQEFGPDHVFSTSQLEKYVRCPFLFFVERVLGIELVETPEEELNALERGRLVHSVLERFHREHRGMSVKEIGLPAAQKRMKKVIDEEFARETRRKGARWAGVLNVERAIAERRLLRYLEKEAEAGAQWKPSHFEVSFGGTPRDNGDPLATEEPCTIELSCGPLRIKGIIDRIDVSDSHFRVVDYKTGKVPKKDAIEQAQSLQLALYVLAVDYLLKREGACVAAAFVGVGEKPEARSIAAGDAAWEQHIAAVLDTAARAIAAMREGVFCPSVDDAPCEYCDVWTVCRREPARVERKKTVDI